LTQINIKLQVIVNFRIKVDFVWFSSSN